MKTLWAVLIILAASAAEATFTERPLADVFDESDLIVDATIISARLVEWSYRNKARVCGRVYEARVNAVIKGSAEHTLTFASNDSFSPSTRQLVFLRSYDGDLPTDVEELFNAKDERNRQHCLKALPKLKTSFLESAEFLGDSVRLSPWLIAPADLRPVTISVAGVHVNGKRLDYPGNIEKLAPAAYEVFLPYLLETQIVKWAELQSWLLKRVQTNAR